MKNIKNVDDINDLRFNLSEDMNNMFMELIITKQILEDSLKEDTKMTDEERGTLYNYFEELKDNFIKDFKKNNKEQIKKYNELINK